MKQTDIFKGETYLAKVSGDVVPVRVDEIDRTEGNRHQKARTIYYCTNLKTKRKITVNSAQRFRGPVPKGKAAKSSGGKQPVLPFVSPAPFVGTTVASTPAQGSEVCDHEWTDGYCRFCDKKEPVDLAQEDEQSADPMEDDAAIAEESPGDMISAPTTVPACSMVLKCGSRVDSPMGQGTLLSDPEDVDVPIVLVELDDPGTGDPMQEFRLEDLEPLAPPPEPMPCVLDQRLTKEDYDGIKYAAAQDEEDGFITHAQASGLLPTEPGDPTTGKCAGDTIITSVVEEIHDSVIITPPVSPQKESAGSIVARKLKEVKEREQAAVAETEVTRVSEKKEHDVRSLVRRGGEHLIVRARAGSGKTTTLVEGMKRVLGLGSELTPSPQQEAVWCAMGESAGIKSIGFVAFNSSIATELKRRVPAGTDAMTMHSMGYKAVTRMFGLSGRDVVNPDRVSEIAAQLLGRDYRDLQKERPGFLGRSGPLQQVVKLCKMRLVGVDDRNRFDVKGADWGREIGNIIGQYEIDFRVGQDEEDCYNLVPRIMERCLDPRQDGCIDFDDQIWLAVVTPGIRLWEYDLLCVDEAQDLNPAQQRLVRKAGRRLVVCGDDRQAIYGFTGADTEGLENMQRGLENTSKGCSLLPLTVTRRCGRAIVEEARRIVPDFEAHESNGEGVVVEARYPIQQTGNYWTGGGKTTRLPWDQTYLKDVEPGDLVICRVNSHLVMQCTEHHKRGNRAFILGRQYGDQYLAFIDKMNCGDMPSLVARVSDWRQEELQKEQAKRSPSDNRIINIESKADTILALCEGSRSVDDVRARVKDLFDDNPDRPGVLHSSIHKAKGLEANNVFFLMPRGGECPHPMAKTSWARHQEMNLKYVGITRAIQSQTFVY